MTAEAAIATFEAKYKLNYERAVACMIKDREALLAFEDLPAGPGDHRRSSNPIESVFATVCHRTVRTKGALSRETARLMMSELVMGAARAGRRLKGLNRLPEVIAGVTCKDGVEVTTADDRDAA